MDDLNENQKPASHVWTIVIVVIVILALAGGGYWWWRQSETKKTSSQITVSTSPTSTTSKASAPEVWTRSSKTIFNATSSDTHKLTDGTYRMYLMQNGSIEYADSTDGITFSTPVSTGIGEDAGMMISNPAVLEVKNGDWIMIYEQSPIKSPGSGQQQSPPGVSNQRNLYLATSTDGKAFTKVGTAIDSSKLDNYFASVPDLVKLPDGNIRMYYVSGGQAIGSVLSADGGRSWIRDSGYRLEDLAVDPDVLVQTKNGVTSYVMYYSVLSGPGNALYKSTSTDGLTWSKGVKIIDSIDSSSSIIDPDVIEVTPGNYRMYFGEMAGDSTAPGSSSMNLLYADFAGDIFQ